MSSIIVMEHSPGEDLGIFADALAEHNLTSRVVQSGAGDPVPTDIGNAPGLIVLGGSMGVYEQDKYTFLKDEINLIRSAIAANRPVFGICLGAQLLAATLGADVYKAPHSEIGWFDIDLTTDALTDPLFSGLGSVVRLFEWHNDRFDLPVNATLLGSSALTPAQAFRYGNNVYGVQFHPEVRQGKIIEWVEETPDVILRAGFDPETVLADTEKFIANQNVIGRQIFSRWAGMVNSS